MNWKRIVLMLIVALLAVPSLVQAQRRWKKTVALHDRRSDDEQPKVADVTFSARWMRSRVSPGQNILMGGDNIAEMVKFSKEREGYIKFKIEKIRWVDAEFDGSPEYKVVVRSLWVSMVPKIFEEAKRFNPGKSTNQLRRMYITAPNVEYVTGDSLPPPIIFKIDQSAEYRFTIGMKAITPNTTLEKPFPFSFSFTIDNLLKDHPSYGDVEPVVVVETVDTVRKVVVEEDKPEDYSLIDQAVKIAIENEDVDALIELIRENPQVPSCINARSELEIYLRRELIDNMTYRVDITYPKFPSKIPKRENLNFAFSIGNRVLGTNESPVMQWKGDKLYVTPKLDSTSYTLTATHRPTPENKHSTTLNISLDNISFSYKYDDPEKTKVAFHIEGGTGPYILHLQRATQGGGLFDMEGGIKIYGDTVLTIDRMARGFKVADEGDFQVFVEDASQLKKTGEGLIHIIPPPPIPPIVWYIAGGVLILFLIGWLIWRRERRRKDEEMQRLMDARGGSEPRVKRKPKPDLLNFWNETAISDLSLHKTFVQEVATYLKERPEHPYDIPMIEGVIMGKVLKFDFEAEQYEVRLDKFRAIEPKVLNFYEDSQDADKWAEIREVTEDHRDLVKIGWLQVVENRPMDLSEMEQQFQDEQFSELFQLIVKIDIVGDDRECGFFTRTTSGKINNTRDRQEGVDYWPDWDKLEDAGYYEPSPKPIRDHTGERIKVRTKIDSGIT